MISLDLEDRSCLVTGATRGIGRAVTRLLLAEGACVTAIGRTSATCDSLRDEFAGFGRRLTVAEQDMSEPASGQAVVAVAKHKFGGLDVVVNNAGAFDAKEPEDIGRDDWASLLNLKLLGYVSVIRAAIPELQKTKGSITNVAGVAGAVADPVVPHVSATNAAVISASRSFALQQAPHGVRVNVVSPGKTATDRYWNSVRRLQEARALSRAEADSALAGTVPLGHIADPDEVARMIVLLASPVMRSITGAHVLVDGGESLGKAPAGSGREAGR